MASQDKPTEHEPPARIAPGAPATSNAALASRFHQMFPVLSAAEIDRVRRFGEVKRFRAGELLYQAGEAVPGMYVMLSGRVAVVPSIDGLESFLVRTFLRRYVTYCARQRRFAAMEGAARLHNAI